MTGSPVFTLTFDTASSPDPSTKSCLFAACKTDVKTGVLNDTAVFEFVRANDIDDDE